MRLHNGMRPQDIAILLKIILKRNRFWSGKELSSELFISQAEVSLSLERNKFAGLLNPDKKKVHLQTLLDFIRFGLHVVFPAIPGGVMTGIYTAHSHPFLQNYFHSNDHYVWSYSEGNGRGQTISPLYSQAVKAALKDPEFYKMLALIDVIRVGKVRELDIAVRELKRMFYE